ncbi:helix-turn-helix domain-containing protein [Nocardioides sp.]|uniref:helix-turn-helix domain-containing protein n=1 Tax=Nocardioides sp. TaxID=35761 RepID=UPI0037CB48E5
MRTSRSWRPPITLSGLEPLLSIQELAEYLDVPVTTIRDWRTDGKGSCAIKVGGRVRFATSDVLAWLLRQREPEPGRGHSGRARVARGPGTHPGTRRRFKRSPRDR